MKNKIIGIFICTLLITTSLPILGATTSSRSLHLSQKFSPVEGLFFDKIIEMIIDHGHFPSVSACIIKGDTVVWSNGYGFSDIENNSLADDNTIYEIASITKTVTGTALMQLYDQGLFDLDDDVNDYLPFSLRNPNFPDIPITHRMLLSHASSIAYTSYWEYMPPLEEFEEWFPDPFLEEYLVPGGSYYNPKAWSTEFGPGEKSAYANMNFEIISYLVELISDQHFVEYCEENIFIPLEMWNTSFYYENLNEEQIAIPYIWNATTGKHDSGLFYYPEWSIPRIYSPVGGLFTSVLDLSHFMIAHMNGGVCNGVRILEEETVMEMHTIQLTSLKYTGYGLAWLFLPRMVFWIGQRLFPSSNLIYSGHGGDMMGYHTFMYDKISEDYAVIYFINTDRMFHSRIWNAAELLKGFLFYKAKQF